MTAHTWGWVEVPDRFQPPEKGRWDGIINLAPFFNWLPINSPEWYELMKEVPRTNGLPDDVSVRVKKDYAFQRSSYFQWGFVAPAYCIAYPDLANFWLRVQPLDLEHSCDRQAYEGWSGLMRILKILVERYGQNHVRIIMWSSVSM